MVLDSASCQLIFDVTMMPGEFEIDTCCVTQNHLWFGDGVYNITPRFVKGTITVVACDCSCHADPQCDGVTDIADVIRAIDRAFREADGTYDSFCRGYGISVDGRTDVDCSGATDILDVVKLIDVSLRGGNPALLFCGPCAVIPTQRRSAPAS
ncbi:MAG: hypothetical protein HY304_09750 [candidate division Zixibacteria bacterium]|nr:hypothetical protein [candidate division Zixibacteria bacterium]